MHAMSRAIPSSRKHDGAPPFVAKDMFGRRAVLRDVTVARVSAVCQNLETQKRSPRGNRSAQGETRMFVFRNARQGLDARHVEGKTPALDIQKTLTATMIPIELHSSYVQTWPNHYQ